MGWAFEWNKRLSGIERLSGIARLSGIKRWSGTAYDLKAPGQTPRPGTRSSTVYWPTMKVPDPIPPFMCMGSVSLFF